MSKRKFDDDQMYGSGTAASNAASEAARVAAALAKQFSAPSTAGKNDQREQNDPDFIKDIEINDLRNRYVLTRASSQSKIYEDTGATVTTKGTWYPDKTIATEKDPPLYLHITADSQEVLDKGIAAVKALMDQELGPLINDYKKPEPRERKRWPEERIPIGLESLRNFNVRAKVVGPGGLFVKHIQAETGARVQVKGMGSGFINQDTGREDEDPMYMNLACPDELMLAKAKELSEDLLIVVREEHEKTIAFNQAFLQQQQQQLQQQAQQQQAQFAQQGQYGQYYAQQYPGYSQYGQAQPPLPGAAAPPPPPPDGEAPPPPPGGDFASQLPPGMANTPEQVAYWQQLASNPQYADYYKQCLAYYQQAAAAAATSQGGPPPQQMPTPASSQPPLPQSQPPPPPSDARREGRGQ